MKTKLFLIALFTCSYMLNIYSQDASYTIYNHRNGNNIYSLAVSDSFVYIGTSNGVYQRDIKGNLIKIHNTASGLLSDLSVLVFAESNNELWISTTTSLQLYDTERYLMFNKNSGLYNDDIFSICSDPDGNTWVANYSGISKYENDTWQSYAIPFEGLDTISFNSIKYHTGSIWGTTSDYGLYVFNGSDWNIHNTINSFPSNNLIGLQNDNFDSLWIASADSGLIEKNSGWVKHYNSILDGKTINDFAIDEHNTKWIFTDKGIVRYSENSWSALDSLSSTSIKTGRIDIENNLWLATDNQLIKYIPANDSLVRFKIEGLLYNAINSILIDKENNKWIANNRGISILNTGWSNIPFEDINNTGGRDFLYITSMQQDTDGNIWASYYYPTDISRLDSNGWNTVSSDKLGLISSLAIDSNNNIWAGDNSYGVQYFDGNQWNDPISSNSLSSKDINCIKIDNKNTIWIGSSKGISKYNGSSYENINIANDVSDIAFDSEGRAWISTMNVSEPGLIMLDNEYQYSYTVDSGLAEKWVREVIIDKENNIWCGLQSNGLSMFNPKKNEWKTFNNLNGLANNQVKALAVDSSNNIYVGTPNGLSVIEETKVSLDVMAVSSKIKSTQKNIYVPIAVKKFKNINQVTFTLHYDQNILQFNGLINSELYDISSNDIDISDTINGNVSLDYNTDKIICQSIKDGTSICNFSFNIKNEMQDSSEISISNVIIRNYNDESLNYEVNSTKFKIGDWIAPDGINSIESNDFIRLYPNPTSDYLNIECYSFIKNLIVFDISGKILNNISINNQRQFKLDIHNYNQGIYFIKTITDKNQKTIKFIKE